MFPARLAIVAIQSLNLKSGNGRNPNCCIAAITFFYPSDLWALHCKVLEDNYELFFCLNNQLYFLVSVTCSPMEISFVEIDEITTPFQFMNSFNLEQPTSIQETVNSND